MGRLSHILCARIVPALVISTAILVGWIASTPLPLGTVFATIFPLMKGHLPATIFGHGRMKGTPPVPEDLMPEPRPEKELFVTLPGGYKMPMNGLGMCCRYSAYDNVLVRRTVLWYLLLGGRHIDTAHVYLNHQAVGQGIRDAMQRGVAREEIFVTTKLWPSFFGYNSTKEIVPTFLEELGLDYVDLVLMHMPKGMRFIVTNDCMKLGISDKQCRQETWKALSELRDEQAIMRNIGVSNFNIQHIKDIEELGLAPIANNQFQWNVFSPPHVQETFDYCLNHHISVTAYYSLGGSLQHAEATTVETLQNMASKFDKTIAQIMLRWSMQKGAVVIPGTGNPKHMKENLETYSFELSDQDMAAIDELKYDEKAKKFMYVDPAKL